MSGHKVENWMLEANELQTKQLNNGTRLARWRWHMVPLDSHLVDTWIDLFPLPHLVLVLSTLLVMPVSLVLLDCLNSRKVSWPIGFHVGSTDRL
jgi:hypothetical protein